MKILVIDDDPLIRRMVRRMLIGPAENRGATVYVIDPAVIRPDAALRRLMSTCEVVLSDYDLGMRTYSQNGIFRAGHPNGLDVLRLAPEGCRRVLMSGDPPSDTSPADVVLEKPFTREQLFAALGLEE